jgi:hypothetical protein
MLLRRVAGIVAIALACALLGSPALEAASPISLQRDGSVEIGGRSLRCGKVRSTLDPRLQNLGISIPARRLLVLNPTLLQRHPHTVRLFVFYHECGHHHVGASEFGADCWAAERGVREGWLDKDGLAQICKSFGNAPATPTHPSAARRCSNLDRCFASVSASIARQSPKAPSAPPVSQSPAEPAKETPNLVTAPALVRSGVAR